MTGQTAAGEAMWVSVQNIVKTEGAPALFKGVIPRMMWIAPLGAMNFAGYELAKRAMQSAEAEAKTKAESGTVTQPAASKPTPAVKPSPLSRLSRQQARTALRRVQTQLWRRSRQQVVQSLQKSRPRAIQSSRGCRTGCVCTSCIDQIVVSPLHRLRWRRTPNLQGQPSE